ncbi:flavodoxin family protein [Methanobrevibacter sp.]|uniref:flavodoxin family protein n=1 Tax=Methanobrevibacter sp. TaxID=66852 RepID=UPI00386E7C6A
MNATMGRASDIDPVSKDPSDYDLVIIGTPVWSSNMAAPIFTYLIKYKDQIKNMASFCTCMGGGYDKALTNIAEVSGKTQISTMFLTSKDLENPDEKIDTFINNIK